MLINKNDNVEVIDEDELEEDLDDEIYETKDELLDEELDEEEKNIIRKRMQISAHGVLHQERTVRKQLPS